MAEQRFVSLYPGYDVLSKWRSPSWNDKTREVVSRRLNDVPPRRFLTPEEWDTLVAVCDRVMPQPDRPEPIPIAPFIDARLQRGEGVGTRYAVLPPDRECWRRGLAAIGSEARERFGRPFSRLDPAEQDIILHAMDDETTASSAWEALPSRPFMRHVLLREVVGIYYAHPAAWSEIGFGGPASPRGYVRLDANRRDGWEAEETQDGPLREARRR